MNVDINKLANVKTRIMMLRLPFAKKILDVGAGRGEFADSYPYIESEITNIDKPNSEDGWFEDCKKRFIAPRYRNIEAYSDKMDMLKDNEFDMVIFNEVIEHLTEEQLKGTMNEIKRVLKPNGLLQVATPNAKIRKLVGKYMANEYHIKEYTNDELKAILKHFNFEIIQNLGMVYVSPKNGQINFDTESQPQDSYCIWFECKNIKGEKNERK